MIPIAIRDRDLLHTVYMGKLLPETGVSLYEKFQNVTVKYQMERIPPFSRVKIPRK